MRRYLRRPVPVPNGQYYQNIKELNSGEELNNNGLESNGENQQVVPGRMRRQIHRNTHISQHNNGLNSNGEPVLNNDNK